MAAEPPTPSDLHLLDTVAQLTRAVMNRLAAHRPAFHSEADFQHAFAWEAHLLQPDLEVRLERRLSANSNERLDLLLVGADATIAVELKYPVTKLETELDGEPFILRAQGAEDGMRFAYVWDIVRLEQLVANGVANAGVAVLLTNFPSLWQLPQRTRGLAADTQFRLHEGQELTGTLGWSGTATWWKGKHPESVQLTGAYPMRWHSYSTVAGQGRGQFRWTAAVVGVRDAGP